MSIKGSFKALIAVIVIGLTILSRNNTEAEASAFVSGERAIGGLAYYLDMIYSNNEKAVELADLFTESVSVPENIAFADVQDYLNIRKSAGTNAAIIGYLPKDGMCEIIESDGEWAHIKSGKVDGYVAVRYLITGEKALEKAEYLSTLKATVIAGTVNFRSEPNTSDPENIIATVSYGERLPIIEECVISKDDDNVIWVKAYCDDLEGYISKEFVEIAYDFDKAVPISAVLNGESKVGANSLRNSIIIEAKKHLGLKYVWGGESLKYGADCSGFCRAVYSACGISIKNLPRTSYDLAASSKGRTVSLSNAQPGDLVFYGSKSGKVNHVAIYMGNGMIIHESGHAYGCKISSVDYRTILKIKNFLD